MALSLLVAVITSSHSPLVLLDGALNVVVASASFCTAFDVDCSRVAGEHFLNIGQGEWDLAELRALLIDTAAGGSQIKAYALDLKTPQGPPRRVVINAHKLDYADLDNVRLMVAVLEVTDARAADLLTDGLHREAFLLLKEVRHRIANSLQIIASVLLLTANRSRSLEVRTQLQSAYLRVMSVASLERQLAPSAVSDVALSAYFATLCESIGGSMIGDPERVALALDVDDSVVPAEISVSLGLIVTELIINALKHAFPADRPGRITIGYRSDGARSVLTVSDDGVGRAHGPAPSSLGMGAMIVEALAKQHGARVEVSDGTPGTTVSIAFG